MKRKSLACFPLFFAFLLPALRASEFRSGGALLSAGIGARAMALGGAASVIVEGPESLYWNPARLTTLERPSLSLTHEPLIEGTRLEQAAFGLKISSMAFGVGYASLLYDPIPATDDVGNSLGTFTADERLINLGLAFQTGRVHWGLVGKYLRSDLDNRRAQTAAMDAGITTPNPFFGCITHAFVAQNIGGSLTYINEKTPLPQNFIFGTAYKNGKNISFEIDVQRNRDQEWNGMAGVEWSLAVAKTSFLHLRGGYTTIRKNLGGLAGASVGAGLTIGSFSLDYAWLPYGDLGDSHVLSFVWKIPPFVTTRSNKKTGSSRLKNQGDGNAPSASGLVSSDVVITYTSGEMVRGRLVQNLPDAFVITVNGRYRTIYKSTVKKIEKDSTHKKK